MNSATDAVYRETAVRFGWRSALAIATDWPVTRTPEWFIRVCGDLMPRRPLTDQELSRYGLKYRNGPVGTRKQAQNGSGSTQHPVGGSFLV